MPGNVGLFIPLTQGYRAVVSPRVYAELAQYKWSVMRARNGTAYAQRKVRCDGKWTNIQMHRVILNAPPEAQVDHIHGVFFGDPSRKILDNRDCNLRLASHAENQRNHQARCRNNTSGHTGVNWHKRDRRWRATIRESQIKRSISATSIRFRKLLITAILPRSSYTAASLL